MEKNIETPFRVRFNKYLEIWPEGTIMKNISGMYKEMDGCIFGLSIQRVLCEISKGNISPINTTTPNK